MPPHLPTGHAPQSIQRLAALLLGCVAALLMVELGLRAAGWWSRRHLITVASPRAETAATSVLRVMCIGESTTFIGGDAAYPVFLGKMLAERLLGKKVEVFNGGIPGANTVQIIERIPTSLDAFRPHIVVAMMGANDQGDKIPFTAGGADAQRPMLRSVRLSRYLVAGRSSDPTTIPGHRAPILARSATQITAIEEAWETASRGYGPQVIRAYEKAIAVAPEQPVLQAELAEMMLISHQEAVRDAAEARLRRLIQQFPTYSRAHLDLALLATCRRDPQSAQEHLKHVLALSPDSIELENPMYVGMVMALTRYPGVLEWLEQICASRPDEIRLCHHLQRVFEVRGDGAHARRYADLAAERSLRWQSPLTAQSYRQLREMLRARKTKLLCLQYAGRDGEGLRRLVGDHPDVWFADTQLEFAQALKLHGFDSLFTDSCYGDIGHCTPLGNEIIARKVADVIVDKHLFETPLP